MSSRRARACIICYKLNCDPTGSGDPQEADDERRDFVKCQEGKLKHYFVLLVRYLDCHNDFGKGGSSDADAEGINCLFQKLVNAGVLLACEDCSKVVEAFCDLYHQLKLIELQLNQKLGTLKEIMVTSERDKTRMQDLREEEGAKLLETEGVSVNGNDIIDFIIRFKGDLVKKCKRKLDGTFPRLALKKYQATSSEPSQGFLQDVPSPSPAIDETGLQVDLVMSPSSPSPPPQSPLVFNSIISQSDQGLELGAKGSRFRLRSLHRCGKCSKSFSSLFKLEDHQQRFHGEEENDEAAYAEMDLDDDDKNNHSDSEDSEELYYSGVEAAAEAEEDPLQLLVPSDMTPSTSVEEAEAEPIHIKEEINFEQAAAVLEDGSIDEMNASPPPRTPAPDEDDKGDINVTETKFDCKCELCGKVFVSLSQYRRHYNSVHSGNRFPCPVCTKVYTRKDALKRHQKTNRKCKVKSDNPPRAKQVGPPEGAIMDPETGKYKCTLCPKEYEIRRLFQSHYRGAHRRNWNKSNQKFKCQLCEKEFAYHKSRWLHIQKVHKGIRHKCPNCGKSFAEKANLAKHQLGGSCGRSGELGGTPGPCHICGKTFSKPCRLQEHMKGVHSKIRDCLCSHCGKGFTSNSYLRRHVRTVHFKLGARTRRSEAEEHLCDLCGKKCKSKAGIEHHHRKSHSESNEDPTKPMQEENAEDKPYIILAPPPEVQKEFGRPHCTLNPETNKYKCDICPKEFSRRGHEFLCHFRSVHLGIRYQCRLCSMEFKSKQYFRIHHQSAHLQLFCLKCELCDKEFSSQGTLNVHRRSAHEAVQFKCLKCNRAFAHQSSLGLHKRSSLSCGWVGRTSPKYKCERCGKEFMTPNALCFHVNTVHLQKRDHLCSQCGKGFPTSCKLKQHREAVHLGLREHLCEGCGRSFKRKSQLVAHRFKEHGEESKQIPYEMVLPSPSQL